jgi:hypothetical protein
MATTVKLTCDACGVDILDPPGPKPVIPMIVEMRTNNAGLSGEFCSHRCLAEWLNKLLGDKAGAEK